MPFTPPITDLPFYLAVATFGFGLSLATYRMTATHYGWPMGRWHARRPAVPILIGFACILVAGGFAFARGAFDSGTGSWTIPFLGIALAIFWTGFLRVGSQVSLLLAPLAVGFLLVGWFGAPGKIDAAAIRDAMRQELKDLREQLGVPERLRPRPDPQR